MPTTPTPTTHATRDGGPEIPVPPIPRRPLGRTGCAVTQFALGGEGVLRTHGRTGHHDPAILLDAMGRFDFDTVLVALNSADVHRLSFARTVLVEADRKRMAVIGMKVYAAGTLVRGGPGALSPAEAMGYVLSL